MIEILVRRETKNNLPDYQHPGDSGMDVRANLEEPVTLKPGERKLIPSGLYFDIPIGYEIQVRPRSGLALKKGITVLNTPGTIDSTFTGEVGVILINLSDQPQTIEPSERIAQLVVSKVEYAKLTEVEVIDKSTTRNSTGYGDSGRF